MKLYTKNNCSACNNVKAYLRSRDIDFEEINIQRDYDAAVTLVEAGFRSVPVLQYGENYIVGAEAIQASV